jgi:hypothetical protein
VNGVGRIGVNRSGSRADVYPSACRHHPGRFPSRALMGRGRKKTPSSVPVSYRNSQPFARTRPNLCAPGVRRRAGCWTRLHPGQLPPAARRARGRGHRTAKSGGGARAADFLPSGAVRGWILAHRGPLAGPGERPTGMVTGHTPGRLRQGPSQSGRFSARVELQHQPRAPAREPPSLANVWPRWPVGPSAGPGRVAGAARAVGPVCQVCQAPTPVADLPGRPKPLCHGPLRRREGAALPPPRAWQTSSPRPPRGRPLSITFPLAHKDLRPSLPYVVGTFALPLGRGGVCAICTAMCTETRSVPQG